MLEECTITDVTMVPGEQVRLGDSLSDKQWQAACGGAAIVFDSGISCMV